MSNARSVRKVSSRFLGAEMRLEVVAPGYWKLLPSGRDLPPALFMHLEPARLGASGARYSRERWSVPGTDRTERTLALAAKSYARSLAAARAVGRMFWLLGQPNGSAAEVVA